MAKDSFIFYKSFYEAISELPNDVKLEVLTAIIEYALFDKLPKNPKPIAKGMFTLIKPNIDVNKIRFENGKKGGRKKKSRAASSNDDYTLTFEQEVERMRKDDDWRKTICDDFNITAEEYDKRLSRFLNRCNEDKERKGKDRHDSFVDCQSHLRYWMSKAYTAPNSHTADNNDNEPPFPTSDYTFDGGFGGEDI